MAAGPQCETAKDSTARPAVRRVGRRTVRRGGEAPVEATSPNRAPEEEQDLVRRGVITSPKTAYHRRTRAPTSCGEAGVKFLDGEAQVARGKEHRADETCPVAEVSRRRRGSQGGSSRSRLACENSDVPAVKGCLVRAQGGNATRPRTARGESFVVGSERRRDRRCRSGWRLQRHESESQAFAALAPIGAMSLRRPRAGAVFSGWCSGDDRDKRKLALGFFARRPPA